jgi:putative transposase
MNCIPRFCIFCYARQYMDSILLTYRYRIKDGSSHRRLNRLSSLVNMIWNFCNATSFKAIRDYGKWISSTQLDALLAGTSKLVGLHSQTVQAISQEYILRRKQFKKRKLRWRISKGSKRSLGWIPWKASGIKVAGDKVKFSGTEFKFWKTRELPSAPKCGSFSQDAQGNWYVNFVVEVPKENVSWQIEEVGVDPGLKDTAVLSDGTRIENPRVFIQMEKKLGDFQRHHKKRQARKLSARIKNIRLDFIHKKTLELTRKYYTFYIGDVSGKFLQASNGKSSQDASTGLFRSILRYKAIRHQGRVIDVSEFASTLTCSKCFKKTGPSGLSGLGVREWFCSDCGSRHDRDVNAATNILRFGRESLRAAKAA